MYYLYIYIYKHICKYIYIYYHTVIYVFGDGHFFAVGVGILIPWIYKAKKNAPIVGFMTWVLSPVITKKDGFIMKNLHLYLLGFQTSHWMGFLSHIFLGLPHRLFALGKLVTKPLGSVGRVARKTMDPPHCN